MTDLTNPTNLYNEHDYGDYIVYVDESGDHSLVGINPQFPIFVLAFCIFDKINYAQKVVPSVQEFKFRHFGHDLVILHEREIRKRQADFSILTNKNKYNGFMADLSSVMANNDYQIISCVIDKLALNEQTAKKEHPYHIALKLCLERLYQFLSEQNQQDKITHIVVEKRGKKEDKELIDEFNQICQGDNCFNRPLPFKIRMADKQANSTGLQFSDMVARPIGTNHLNPEQTNRAFEVLQDKLLADEV